MLNRIDGKELDKNLDTIRKELAELGKVTEEEYDKERIRMLCRRKPRTLKLDMVGEATISTIMNGTESSFYKDGCPLLYSTIVQDEVILSHTEEEALKVHGAMVKMVKESHQLRADLKHGFMKAIYGEEAPRQPKISDRVFAQFHRDMQDLAEALGEMDIPETEEEKKRRDQILDGYYGG
jgi:hypothetical protein